MTRRWDRAESLALLDRVHAAAIRMGADGGVVAAIERQAGLLANETVLPPEAFAALPGQLLHGDFHDQQVLFRDDDAVALVDWKIWHVGPRAWELLRSLAFSGLLESPLLDEYLAGYRGHQRLTREECRLALQLWWQGRVTGLWVWAAYFLEGNTRVRELFPATIADLELASDGRRRHAIDEGSMKGALGD